MRAENAESQRTGARERDGASAKKVNAANIAHNYSKHKYNRKSTRILRGKWLDKANCVYTF